MTSNQAEKSTGRQLTPPEGRRRCLTCLLLGIVFASGLVAGGGLTIILGLGQRRRGRPMEEVRDELTDMFADRLGLSQAQIPKVRDVVEARLIDHFRQRDRQLTLMDQHIRPVLNDEQIPKWAELHAELMKKYSKNRQTTTQPGGQ